MHITHHTISLAKHTLHRIDFDPATLTPGDLLWLPYHAELAAAGRKRQAEHLAGRIAAVHALQPFGSTTAPVIGAQRQPCWPPGLFGSITHCENHALAVVARHPIGVDSESLFSSELCAELTESIITSAERAVLEASGLPYPLALTLAFSAKESLYKAFSHRALPLPGFTSAAITHLDPRYLTLRFRATFSPQLVDQQATVYWQTDNAKVVTLAVS